MSTDDTPTTDAPTDVQTADLPVDTDSEADIWTVDGSHITGTPVSGKITTSPEAKLTVVTITLQPATWHGKPVRYVLLTGHHNPDRDEDAWAAQVFPDDGGEPVTLEVDTFDPDLDSINEVVSDE